MKKTFQMFRDSFKEFKSLNTIVIAALMGSLAVVLRYVATINFGPYIRVGFSSMPNHVVEFLFGPVVGSIFGGSMDLVNYFMRPTGPFFPGFTLNAIILGLIYGVLLYKKPVNWIRVLLAVFLEKTIINCGLTTLWLSILYGKGFLAILPMRIVANAFMLPIDFVILMVLLTFVEKVIKPMLKKM